MNRGNAWYWTVVFVTRRIIFGLLGGTTVRGLENVPKTGSVILAPVHVSYIDPMLVGCTSPRALRFMAKEELFKGLLGWLLRSVGSFAVKRGETDTSAIRYALETLQEGNALMLFPEGTRGDAQTLGPFQPGVAMMAKKTNAQVVPVGIGGSEKMLPKGGKLRRARLTIVYGEPFTYQELEGQFGKKEAREAFNQKLKEEIHRLSVQAGMPLLPLPGPQTKTDDPKTASPTAPQT